MSFLNTSAILISLAAIFSYLNHRFVRLPATIGLMLISLGLSLLLILSGYLGGEEIRQGAQLFLRGIDFHETLMQGMLSFLLFAGALHVNLADLARQRGLIAILATLGVLISTFVVGTLTWWLLSLLGMDLPLIYCFLFGALISPTDPIAVLGILKTAGAPRSLETKITGESLFNDGVGVVVFIVLLGLAGGGHELTVSSITLLFLKEAVGGILFGIAIGMVAFYMLRSIDSYQVEILISLALVMGGYALASALHLSGPIAMVVAGLIIGNHGRAKAMSEKTRQHLDNFWELVDEFLNAVLFVLIGLEVLVLSFRSEYLQAALMLIPVVILSRFISVGGPVLLLSPFRKYSRGVIPVMTWGGLRGGISVALALSLPLGEVRETLLTVTYVIVVFSIAVQGLTIGPLVRRMIGSEGKFLK